jgi:uncharacterized protein DUF1565
LVVIVLAGGAFLLHAACNRSTTPGSSSGGGSATGGGVNSGGGGAASVSCTLKGGGTGPSGNNPADFPSVAGLDFTAFPADPGACTGAHISYVSTSGSDSNPGTSPQPFRTLVHAIQTAAPGDAVMVHAGTYAEGADGEYRSLVIDKANLKLCAAPGETVTVQPPSPAFTYGLQILADGAVIDGINLSGYVNGVEMGGDPGTKVSHLVFKNLTVTASGATFKNGIVSSVAQVDGLLLKNVTVKNATLSVSCGNGPCKNWRLDGVAVCNDANDVGGSGGDGIAVEVRDEDVAAGNVSQNILISNAEVTGASADGIDLKATRVAVFNANVHDNLRNGVKFWRGGDLVNSFVVHHGADAAVVFDRDGTYRILNSLVAYENVRSDGTLQGDSYTMTICYDNPSATCPLTIVNSVFFNNSGSLFFSNGTTATIQNSLLGNTLNDVIAEKSGTMVLETDPASNLSSIATASGNLPFTTNPGFTNAGGGDFTFGSSSPLKNAGAVPSNFPSYDFRGNSRNQGGAPDLGPLELF